MPHSSIVINKKIIGLPPTVQQNSLDLADGDKQSFSVISNATVGITDTWSIMVWAKNASPDSENFSRGLMAVNARAGVLANQIAMEGEGGGTFRNKHMRIRVYRSDNQFQQLKTWNDVMEGDTDTWVQYVLTWGGDAGTGALGLKLYTQGADNGAATATSVDNASSAGAGITDTARGVSLGIAGTLTAGANPWWNGRIYSAAIYDSVLSASEITAMYNAGNARDFDLESDHSGYTSSGSLLHYFRVGLGSTELEMGADETGISNDLSMSSRTSSPDGPVGSVAITTADKNADVPDGT
jgi:hypothetical protein